MTDPVHKLPVRQRIRLAVSLVLAVLALALAAFALRGATGL